MEKLRLFQRVLLVFAIVQTFAILWSFSSLNKTEDERVCSFYEPIDVVYTWVNGSDPEFIKNLNQYFPNSDYQPSRYQDFDQLLFSLRSIEKYASWVRHVYIVTNGQIPNWLNIDSAYVTIIPHNEIYQNKSHLPTFSSPSIECHLHEIRNLSEKFIYFNDDITFFNPICPEDYFEDENYKLYLNGKSSGYPSGQRIYEDVCSEECEELFNNNVCDPECNLLECLFDNGDCDGEDNPDQPMTGEPFYRSIDFVNLLFNRKFNLDERHRQWIPHMPFLFSKSILKELHAIFAKEINLTSSHRTRAKNDVQLAFSYFHYLNEQEKFNKTVLDGNRYGLYAYVNDNIFHVRNLLNQIFRPSWLFETKSAGFWLCVNDGMDPDHPDHVQIRSFLHEWYEALYPIPSQFEKNYKMVQNAQKYDWPSLHDHKRNKTIHIGDFVTKIDSETVDNATGWLYLLAFKNLLYLVIIPFVLVSLYNLVLRPTRKRRRRPTFKK